MDKRKKRRSFSQDFKKEVVALYRSGRSRKEIIQEYDLTPSAFDKWVRQFSETSEEENVDKDLTPEQRELKELRKENAKLRMENEVLKQAALIFGRMAK
ncbi:Mobile element protein [Alkalibacterium sp. AK22]|nr:transposase [Alkalibacterium sp. AK22]EXJ23750.1 Mobile element protein [Alkalibacterium sp. AK22]